MLKCVTQIGDDGNNSFPFSGEMHCILINSNNLKQVKFIQKFNAIYHSAESEESEEIMRGEVSPKLLMLLLLLFGRKKKCF